MTDGAESQNSQPRAKFIPQNFPQGAQIYLIREMWREGCVFQCVCVCVCVCVGLQICAEEAEEAWPPVMADTEPICLKPVAPSTTSSPLTQTHTHTHSTLSKRLCFSAPPPKKKKETQIDTDFMMATHVASFAYLQMHWESYFETDTHTQKETIKDRPYVSHM